MFSIDQNSTSLWDALPKLHALAARKQPVRHFLEDVDVAFTALGSAAGGSSLRLARERFHRGGGADWGAALFYTEFLGKQFVDLRQWEPYLGLSLKALARRLGRTVDELYQRYSPGDNWQLIGPSYVGDKAHHRVLGDLTLAETRPFVRQIITKARQDVKARFPCPDASARVHPWFEKEQALVEGLMERNAAGRLVDLYRGWMEHHVGPLVKLDLSSNLLAVGADGGRTELLELFCRDYDLAAGLYNQSLSETMPALHHLDVSRGELPFFAVFEHQGHAVRTEVLLEGQAIRIAERTFPLASGRRLPVEELKRAGVRCLAGKAVLLVIQARLNPGGCALAVPYRGSSYMPASHRLAAKLQAHHLLAGSLHPLVRVRFRLLDHLRELDTVIRLPDYLASYFGSDEIPARALGEAHQAIAADAAARLQLLLDAQTRRQFQRKAWPQLTDELHALDHQRRSIAAVNDEDERLRDIWRRIKALRLKLLERTLEQVATDWQGRDLDYYDSRGALLPWCLALGGPAFYDKVVREAQVYEEHSS